MKKTENQINLESILDKFGAQLGEIAWYDATSDDRVHDMVVAQAKEMRETILKYLPDVPKRQLKILEVGAYQHYTVHLLGDEFDCTSVASDISATSLRIGAEMATERGLTARAVLVACDFHNMPYSNGYFDFVYIASAVHHTWQTRTVLDELLRVTKPGGVLMLANEPVKRELCFYQFRSNRPEYFTDWERMLDSAGLMNIVSSPFLGSRDEEIFGIIENDRIPWSVFAEFFDCCEILEKSLTPIQNSVDQRIQLECRSTDQVADFIEKLIAPIREKKDVVAEILGFSVPNSEAVNSLCNSVASLFEEVRAGGANSHLAQCRLFGAALRAVVRKPVNREKQNAILWRREVPLDKGVHIEYPIHPNINVRLDKIQFPSINSDNEIVLNKIFPPDQWTLFNEGSTRWSMLIKSMEGDIFLPQRETSGVLLLRLYGVSHRDGPYRIMVATGDHDASFIDVARSESRMCPVYLPSASSRIRVRAIFQDDKSHEFAHHIRVAVCKFVPVEISTVANDSNSIAPVRNTPA